MTTKCDVINGPCACGSWHPGGEGFGQPGMWPNGLPNGGDTTEPVDCQLGEPPPPTPENQLLFMKRIWLVTNRSLTECEWRVEVVRNILETVLSGYNGVAPLDSIEAARLRLLRQAAKLCGSKEENL